MGTNVCKMWLVFILFGYTTAVSGLKEDYRGPGFVVEPASIVRFSNSSGTVVLCSAEGRPSPELTWTKHDGLPVDDVPGLRVIRHDGSLAFAPFAGEDYRADVHATIYKCIATNVVGSVASRDVHVNAVVPQKYEIRLFDEFVLKGNMAVLRCPVPSFVSDYVKVTSWERMDGFVVTPNILSGKYGMLDNGDLYVRDIVEQDGTHSFQCHTENIVTKEKKASVNYAKIKVTEPHHRQPPRVLRQSSAIAVAVGERAVLSCIAQGFPAPTYRWQKIGDHMPLQSFDSPVRQQSGVIVIQKAITSNSGIYLCVANNPMGEERVEIELIVEESLQVSLYPKEVRADVGKSVTFNCSVSLSPKGRNVIWRKDTRPLVQDSRIIFLSPTALQIRRLVRKDAGMYQCFVNTDHNSEGSSARLIIGDLPPKLKVTFSEKIVTPGSYVSFSCVTSGNPPPQIYWTLDGIWPINPRHGMSVGSHTLTHGDVISYLNISSVDVTDSGLYTCDARNDVGSDSHSRRLNVYGPLLIRPLNNVTAISGDLFSMQCPFGGYPFETVQWKRDNRVLPVNQRQRVFPNDTFMIQDVQPGIDDGKYSCEVRSGHGNPVSRSFQLVIRSRPKLSPFVFQDNLHEGQRTAITCIVLAGDPPFNLRWTKDGMPLSDGVLDANIFIHDNGLVSTLIIHSLAYRHNGEYTCLASNDFATGTYSSKLTVKVPPRWILEPREASAVSGRPARMDCQADGVPQPHIRWKLATGHLPENFKTIVSSSHVHILVNGSLNFRNVEPTDSGFYLCEASNGVGPAISTVVKFTVHSAPQFQSKFGMITTRRGQSATIECSARGDKPMSFSWKKNGEFLDPDGEPRYTHTKEDNNDGINAKLFITKIERKDSALFTCTAANDYGEDNLNTQVTVQDIPDAPQNLEVHDVSSSSVRLTWNRPFDGNSPITQYTIAWRQLNEDVTGGPQTVSGSESTLSIRGLLQKTRYFFRVKGENMLGDSQYSAEVAVTTLEEPPRAAPQLLKVTPISSTSLNVSWQVALEDQSNPNVGGFYVGYKMKGSQNHYTFKPVDVTLGETVHYMVLYGLEKHQDYSVVVQAYNSQGAGPPSEMIAIKTLEYDPPNTPTIKNYQTSSKTLKINWDSNSVAAAPVSGYILNHRTESTMWQETHVNSDRSSHTLRDLHCGTTYQCYLVAFNNVGRSNASDTISAKTDGNAPIAPDKRSLLSVNSTSAYIHLSSWKNGGCPITFFIVQYKSSGQREWTLVSNNILPEQHNVTISDLSPGSWYSLLMTARNDAGSTDAEYVFATLTASGEYPPHPSEVSDVMNSSLHRHLIITVPVVSSVLILAVVLCVVCLMTRRRTANNGPRAQGGPPDSEPTKGENMPLSVTYEHKQEPIYFPSPYAATRVPFSSKEPGGTQSSNQDMGTFGSTRSGYIYDIPYPPNRSEKSVENFDPPVIYFPAYHHIGVEIRTNAVYEVPDRGRMKNGLAKRSWRESGDGSSSNESDTEGEVLYSERSPKERMLLEEARESETECDRLWKILEDSHYESSKRWVPEHAILS